LDEISNLEHSGYIVGGWPWQILGAIHPVAIAKQPGEILFLSGKQRTSPIFRRLNFTTFELNASISVAIKTFKQNCENFTVSGRFPKTA